MDDGVFLSRIQFAITVGFHFLFPPLTIGLAWLLVIVEGLAWKTRAPAYEQAGRFFGKLLGLTFAMGVATGIVMEFQFGTNWAEYSKFVGDIFGAPLAAEALFAFFLESVFLGLYLLGRGRVRKGLHWFAILMVAIGSTISAFWILVANSWQQTPAGFEFNETLGRAELVDFWAAVFNPSTLPRFFHTMVAGLVSGAFLAIGISAALLRKDAENQPARKMMKVAVVLGLIAAIMVAHPTGHEHARQVARTQPEKFAAIEGIYESQNGASLVVFGLVKEDPPRLDAEVRLPIPGSLSWLAFGDANAKIAGLNSFEADAIPPLWLTFVSFHNMVILGTLFILLLLWAVVQLARGKLWHSRRLLKLLILAIPLPLVACQFGWVTAEVGRQPWIVYRLLRTSDAASTAVSAGEVWFSLILFSAIYLALLVLYLFMLVREVQHGPQPLVAKEAQP